MSFTIGERDFLLDGEPHQIISGALHYFRVHPDHWADRIHKARLMGLNAIETYVPWNAHAPRRGTFLTEDGLDLGRFLRLIADEGMHAIVRPGPYICAEWDNGGLPAWLFRDPKVLPRRSEPKFLAAVTEYLEQVYAIVAPLQVDRGGPVILVQIENEYGAYGADKEYLAELVRVTLENGITVPLTTIDQPTAQMLEDGSIPGLHRTASFGSRSEERMRVLREHQPTGPLMCMEFWNGWFDSWGTYHHTTPVEQTAAELDTILRAGGSVNLYMFHGGTNFGVTSGANDKGTYRAITTSYDYDAPLDEAGNPTAKFFAFREVISRYTEVPAEVPVPAGPAPELEVTFTSRSPLVELERRIGTTAQHVDPPTFDDLDTDATLAVYRRRLDVGGPAALHVGEVRDQLWASLDGAAVGTLSRELHQHALALAEARGELALVVEDLGRVDYGPRLGERKGIIGPVTLDGEALTGWSVTVVDLGAVADLGLGSDRVVGPGAAKAEFTLAAPSDLFLDTAGMGRGYAWVNGFALGRYNTRGPQRTLFVPGPVTRAGANELVVLELDVLAPGTRFVAAPLLGAIED